ncbi:MAG TPA: SAM-dependent methyltransferase [Trebonia sp.]|jgi:SAM-dependent methyltransferase|nr:SAM-dependent methyltransferase [Trebonia sp.]
MKYRLAEESLVRPAFDVSVPHPARVWNYWLGGKDHFAADRAAGQAAVEAMPLMPVIARVTRRFARAVVRELAGDGIHQFLDIGMGLPAGDDSTHEVAQRVAPDARVVYVDNDPVAVSHARALLVRRGTGMTDCLDADLRDTGEILDGAARALDFGRPVAVLLSAVLEFIPDADDPWAVVARLRDALAPGSYVLVAHLASDIEAEAVADMADGYSERAAVPITPRGRSQVVRFFDGMTLAGPGVVPATGWYGPDDGVDVLPAYFGLAVKRDLP